MNEKEFEAFIVKSNYIKPKTGNVLISAPLITDIYFKNTILFLTEHNYQGSFGLVLNRPHKKNYMRFLQVLSKKTFLFLMVVL
ncbi:MAG: YqgE/AlgH family protein [Bacteroidales bacterium]|nr:YqgE/AlgH family protein [Bacteroidales bacterium]